MIAAVIPRSRIEFRVAARTHVGIERKNNEDRLLVADLGTRTQHVGACQGAFEADNGGALFAVCDGMGGEEGGEIASSMAIDALFRTGAATFPGRSEREVARALFESVGSASHEIELRARAERALSRMGTTATVCTIAGDSLLVAQVGDSRAYLFRSGTLYQLTRDQTLRTLLMERGQLSAEHATEIGGHVILQALGHHGGVDVDLGWVGLAEGDVLLLCSDGLHGCVPEAEISRTLAMSAGPESACDRLIALALDAGGPDNVTCVVARCHGALPPPGSEPPVLRKVELEPLPTGRRLGAHGKISRST
jgi:protein phosphatase